MILINSFNKNRKTCYQTFTQLIYQIVIDLLAQEYKNEIQSYF